MIEIKNKLSGTQKSTSSSQGKKRQKWLVNEASLQWRQSDGSATTDGHRHTVDLHFARKFFARELAPTQPRKKIARRLEVDGDGYWQAGHTHQCGCVYQSCVN